VEIFYSTCSTFPEHSRQRRQELDAPQAAAIPSQAFADTPTGQSLLKLDESQRKRLESLLKTA
jgi:hypothetical protein